MNKNCEICGSGCEKRFCKECCLKVADKQHCVICIRCRETLGKAASIRWMERKNLHPNIDEMAKKLGASCFFAINQCETCLGDRYNEKILDDDPVTLQLGGLFGNVERAAGVS